jgi:hypothetical protein
MVDARKSSTYKSEVSSESEDDEPRSHIKKRMELEKAGISNLGNELGKIANDSKMEIFNMRNDMEMKIAKIRIDVENEANRIRGDTEKKTTRIQGVLDETIRRIERFEEQLAALKVAKY